MLQTNLVIRILNATSALAVSAVLLGTTFNAPNWAMDTTEDSSLRKTYPIAKLEDYKDFIEGRLSDIPPLKAGDIWLINVGYGLVQSAEWVTRENTEGTIFEKHVSFISSVEEKNKDDYTTLTVKLALASGQEFVKEGAKGLFSRLDKVSANGIYILPITSRYDGPKGRSRTEKEFDLLGCKWESWNQPTPFQNLKEALVLDEDKDNTAKYGVYRQRNGITYSIEGPTDPEEKGVPHKTGAIIGLIKMLKKAGGTLPSAIYFTDREKEINKTIKDLESRDEALEVPLYLLKYTQPKAFRTPEDLEEFYIHRLKDRFQEYRAEFQKAFYSEK